LPLLSPKLASNCQYLFCIAICAQKWDVIVGVLGYRVPIFKAFGVAVGAAYQPVGGGGNPKLMLIELRLVENASGLNAIRARGIGRMWRKRFWTGMVEKLKRLCPAAQA
jgi:hypothetical protein